MFWMLSCKCRFSMSLGITQLSLHNELGRCVKWYSQMYRPCHSPLQELLWEMLLSHRALGLQKGEKLFPLLYVVMEKPCWSAASFSNLTTKCLGETREGHPLARANLGTAGRSPSAAELNGTGRSQICRCPGTCGEGKGNHVVSGK